MYRNLLLLFFLRYTQIYNFQYLHAFLYNTGLYILLLFFFCSKIHDICDDYIISISHIYVNILFVHEAFELLYYIIYVHIYMYINEEKEVNICIIRVYYNIDNIHNDGIKVINSN